MSSVKRKMPVSGLLERRVRPRKEAEPEPEELSESEFEFDEQEDEEMGSGSGSAGSSEDDEDEDEEDEVADASAAASQLSFGALARAQASLGSSKRKAKDGSTDGADPSDRRERERSSKKKEEHHRSSKHAPMEMSSKKQVSRRREFLLDPPVAKPQPRDPRFMPLVAGGGSGKMTGGKVAVEEIKARKAYSFLDQYRDDEMKKLRATIKEMQSKKRKDMAAIEELQRALMSMESRKKAQERKDRERAVIEEHRRQEKELVKQGKTPFYLKRSEQKKRLLLDQFAGLSKGKVDKVIERRRKKILGKEKKMLPETRRTAEER
ncbi:hypothetical protein QBC46DRAFT_118815 [Diplogelasinospora grovesii]|uniref:rRNA biogenesis protein RRP36 n=1 Tax=Diplogelasinospora grovesii TaxID=303347 RepID=A0AAN6N9W1_9PEZI|nr:hypothetical protein QBC46DRAFT_118815 [Diplogelasinospora grovesii]